MLGVAGLSKKGPQQWLQGTDSLAAVEDDGLKKLLMSWYYAGYYTGLYEGQQAKQQQRQ
jgi:hypothetical protein